MSQPYALITTPAEAAYCRDCETNGTRFPGDTRTYPHCPRCGTTNLIDQRSPWEVVAEAEALAREPGIDPGLRVGRLDVVETVRRIAEASECECMDCRAWKPRVQGVAR